MAVVVIAIVGGWQFWNAQKANAARTNAEAFSEAVNTEEATASLSELTALRQDAPAGYSALAGFRIAGLEAQNGNTEGAIATLNSVAANDSIPDRLRNLATVKAAYMALDESPDAALRQLNGLQDGDSVISAYAKEIAGLAAIESGDYAAAVTYFDAIPTIENVPDPIVQRAQGFRAIASLGASGVSLETQSMGQSLESLLDLPVPAEAETDALLGSEGLDGDGESAPVAGTDPAEGTDSAAAEADENDTQEDGTSSD
nr:tetratricopeptide repeat protein [Aquisalinus flavus]